jgi:hypothetical protein
MYRVHGLDDDDDSHGTMNIDIEAVLGVEDRITQILQ